MDKNFYSCLELVKENIKTWDDIQGRHRDLLNALIDLSLQSPKKAEEGFINIELNEAVNKLNPRNPWPKPTDGATKRVNTEWKKLESLWGKKEEGLHQRALASNLTGFIKLKKRTGGGGGNPSRYSFAYEAFDPKLDKSYEKSPLNQGEIRYFTEDVIKPSGLASILSNKLVLSGWGKGVFLSSTVFIGLLIISLLLLVPVGLTQQETAGETIHFLSSIFILLGLIWYSFSPIYHVVESRAEVAPWWLQPGIHSDYLLIFNRNKPQSANTVERKRFTSECPNCKGRIIIKKGRLTNSGRLIGHCENSPREHLFSFDHYLRTGRPL
ncbi:hypothetical protein A9Q82_01720 [Cycloclasticus sp. 46_120_T64]|nr:hypothetical protein A9Q82_01720 [Cycloclasticus sp. 46_120_T64]